MVERARTTARRASPAFVDIRSHLGAESPQQNRASRTTRARLTPGGEGGIAAGDQKIPHFGYRAGGTQPLPWPQPSAGALHSVGGRRQLRTSESYWWSYSTPRVTTKRGQGDQDVLHERLATPREPGPANHHGGPVR